MVVSIVHGHAHRPRPRHIPRPSRSASRPPPQRKRVRTILEATIDSLLKSSRNTASRHRSEKIKIKVPKLKLKTFKKPKPRPHRRRPRPHRRPRLPPPRDSREATTISPPPPPPPSPTPKSVPISSTPPSIDFLSEPKPTKLFKFELSEAKPTNYPLTAHEPVIHGDSATPSSPAFYLREIDDNVGFGGEVFPEEITNSFNEFSSVAGSDGKFLSKLLKYIFSSFFKK